MNAEKMPSFSGAAMPRKKGSGEDLEAISSFAEQAMELAQEVGILEKRGDTVVVHPEALTRIRKSSGMLREHGETDRIYLPRGVSPFNFIAELAGVRAVTEEDIAAAKVEGKEPRPRPFIYEPASAAAALDPEALKNDESIIAPWDALSKYPWNYAYRFDDGSELGADEVAIAHRLFHDLGATRAPDGQLLVRDAVSGEWVRPTSELLRSAKLPSKVASGGQEHFFASPASYLIRYCPNLIESGLIAPDDFNVTEQRGGALLQEKRRFQNGAAVRIAGATYRLGARFDPRADPDIAEKFYGVQLSDALAGIVERRPDGTEQIAYTFALKSKEEIDERREHIAYDIAVNRRKGTASSYLSFGKKDGIEAVPYSITGENKPLKGETSEQYAERIRLIANFNFTNTLSREIAVKTGIGIHVALSLREQQWLATAAGAMHGNKEAIIEKARRFGVPFLRTFLSAEHGPAYGQQAIALAEGAPHDVADAIFKKYSTIVRATEDVQRYLEELYGADAGSRERIEAVTARMLERGKELIARFAARLSNGALVKEEALHELRMLSTEIMLFGATFRELCGEPDGCVPFEWIADTEIAVVPANELTEDNRRAMADVFKETHEGTYLTHEVTRREEDEFEDILRRDNVTFHILKYKGEIVAFIRFEQLQSGNLLAGSLNVRKSAQSSSIGEAMVESTIRRRVQGGAVIEAEAYANNPVLPWYVEKLGFVLDGYDPSFRAPLFHMRVSAATDNLPSRFIEKEEAASHWAVYYDLATESDLFENDITERLQGGEVISRYLVDPREPNSIGIVFDALDATPKRRRTKR